MVKKMKNILEGLTHLVGRVKKTYYFEDFIRVYPNGIKYNRLGFQRKSSSSDFKNFLNHCKFYSFASQFVRDLSVVDLGCGSGYGAKILHKRGAIKVCGYDASKPAIKFAQKNFSDYGDFRRANILNLYPIKDNSFEVALCSEVLEHVKEYNKEMLALEEMKRVTKKGGLVIIGTPNSELLKDHGFTYGEINSLISKYFLDFVIFENAFISTDSFEKWEARRKSGSHGVQVAHDLNMEEVVGSVKENLMVKKGTQTGNYVLKGINIDTSLLHNTHSWIVVAINN